MEWQEDWWKELTLQRYLFSSPQHVVHLAVKYMPYVVSAKLNVVVGLMPLRNEINRLDNMVLHLISERMEVCRNVGKIKLMVGKPVFDPDREREVIENGVNFSRALGIDEEFVRKIMSLIMDYSKRVQILEMQGANGGLSSAKIGNLAQ